MGKLRYRLAGLVAEHDEWQWLNERLAVAVNQSGRSRAAAGAELGRLLGEGRRSLRDISGGNPGRSPSSQRLKSAASQLADPATEDEMETTDFEFWNFRRSCVDRFVEVDDELNELCAAITEFGGAIEVLLQ